MPKNPPQNQHLRLINAPLHLINEFCLHMTICKLLFRQKPAQDEVANVEENSTSTPLLVLMIVFLWNSFCSFAFRFSSLLSVHFTSAFSPLFIVCLLILYPFLHYHFHNCCFVIVAVVFQFPKLVVVYIRMALKSSHFFYVLL